MDISYDIPQNIDPGEPLHIVAMVFALAWLVQVVYYLVVYGRVAFARPKTKKEAKQEPVSVIICARDEAVNLKKNLPAFLGQDYPDYEVVVVNDCSEDNSEEVLEVFKKKYKHLRSTTIKKDMKFSHGKKMALNIGIKAASHEHLLLSDADCHPVSDKWIRTMQRNFSPGTDFVLGYGGYTHGKGLLNRWIRYDTLLIAMQYLGLARLGMPYMGVGRNLAYRKDVYFRNKGFYGHMHLASGDDDLFVNQNAKGKSTAVELSPQSFTRSEPERKWGQWLKQKRRHMTTGPLYKTKHKIALSIEPISRMLFYGSFIALVASLFFPLFFLSVYLARAIIRQIILFKSMRRLKEKKLFVTSLCFDLIMPLVSISILVHNLSQKTSKR